MVIFMFLFSSSSRLFRPTTGYNHSGKRGQVNFLNGVMGIANAQRMLDYIRIIAEFISQPEYKDVVQMFGVINERALPFYSARHRAEIACAALMSAIGRPQVSAL